MTPALRPLILLLSGLLGLALAVSALTGRVAISPGHVLSAADTLVRSLLPGGEGPAIALGALGPSEQVFFFVRLPRCIMAVMVGAGLAASGAVYQALFRNPLVSPDILGVSAGCTFGAALGLMLPWGSMGVVHLMAFGSGLVAVMLTAGLARAIAVNPLIVLVLAGMVVLSFFNALLMVVKYFADPYEQLPGIIFWVMGSLTRSTWTDALFLVPSTLAGIVTFIALGFRLNILSLGDVQARSLGINPVLFRRVLILISSVLVALAVSGCGQIAWIGLIVPHMARALAGPNHERMLPVSALLGGICLLLADTAARSLFTSEIPVGIITALTGAPVFAWLLFKHRGSGWM
ncbi:MAG: iron ABC transporter permease [Desulfobacterales bacterium]|nr:iron ABC transporter permease [Desulfobacterales bacterium]